MTELQRSVGPDWRSGARARRLLGWSSEKLNAVAGLPSGVVERYEKTSRIRRQKRIDTPVDRLAELREVLESAGVMFTDEDDAGLGVRLRDPAA